MKKYIVFSKADDYGEMLINNKLLKFILDQKDKWWNKHEQDMYEEVEKTHRDERAHLVEREKQLKQVHTMELDAISCMSIEQFVVWRDYRKQRPALDQAIDIVKDNK